MSEELKALNETNPQDYQKVHEVIHELLNDRELAKSNNLPEMIRRAYCAGYADSKNTRPIEDELQARVKELEGRLFKARFVIRVQMSWKKEARKELAALKQWQREAVKYLPFVKDEFETVMNERRNLIRVIKKSEQEDQEYLDYLSDFTIVTDLIKQAEEK